MKKILLTLIMTCTFAIGMQAQEIYKEVKNLQKKVETIVNDSTKDIETRKVACFKYDAIYYLIGKALIKATSRTATINNSLSNDTDQEVTYGYVDNEKYITQFSLDTDWVKALAEVK